MSPLPFITHLAKIFFTKMATVYCPNLKRKMKEAWVRAPGQ